MKLRNIKSILAWTASFLFAAGLGIYFRTYLLHHNHSPNASRLMAALYVENNMVERFHKEVDVESPNLSKEDKLKYARNLARNEILSDQDGYEQNIKNAMRHFEGILPQDSGRKYLLEADPYYYFYLTEQITKHGKLSPEKIREGQYFHPLMHAPDGLWTAVTWHPYVGYGIGCLIHWFAPSMEWMERLCWVPLVLSVLACLSLFFFAKALQIHVFSFLIGGLALMLSPIFIQRSMFGWYDTDPYNYIFPFSILAFVAGGLRHPKKASLCAIGSGFLTGLYGLFWTGWPFMFILLPVAFVLTYFILRYLFKFNTTWTKTLGHYLVVHIAASIFFAILLLTPAGVLKSIQDGWNILCQFALQSNDIWPNIFLTVGEARGVSFKKLIYISGNYVTFSIAVFGLVSTFYRAIRSADTERIGQWLIFFIFSIPLCLLALKTERFGILFIIPLVIWVMFGVREIMCAVESWFGKLQMLSGFAAQIKIISGAVILVIFLSISLITAHFISSRVKPIMDDAWYDSMQALRKKTPLDAIVNSWWPPGYFISALAHRRVVADGGTQNFHEVYWLARILASTDEREAAGLLRMLNTSGNRALFLLQSAGFNLAQAIDLIASGAPLARSDAEVYLSAKMTPQIKAEFLNLTQPQNLPSSYVLVYTDMINQNLAITMVARWNFQKALEIQKKDGGGGTVDYSDKFISMTDGLLKYATPKDISKREGNVLFFPDNLIINLDTMEASIALHDQSQYGKPASIFFMKNGKLNEKILEGQNRLDVSVLLIEPAEGMYQCVLADAQLIRSLMFRLYYLKGEGLHYFKPFSWHRNPLNGDQVGIFELVDISN